MIEIREEGGCELYSIYINGYYYGDVSGDDEIDPDTARLLTVCNCQEHNGLWCTCRCHKNE
jgi:hypothetical protein